MSDAQKAVHLGHPVKHTLGFLGMLLGALLGAALVLLAAAAMGPIGLFAIGAACMGASILGGLGMSLGSGKGITTGALIMPCAIDVLSEGKPAAHTTSLVGCGGTIPFFSHGGATIAEGSQTVMVNGKYAARVNSRATCGAIAGGGCASVIIGGPTVQVAPIKSDIPKWAGTFLKVLSFVGQLFMGIALAAVSITQTFSLGNFLGEYITGYIKSTVFSQVLNFAQELFLEYICTSNSCREIFGYAMMALSFYGIYKGMTGLYKSLKQYHANKDIFDYLTANGITDETKPLAQTEEPNENTNPTTPETQNNNTNNQPISNEDHSDGIDNDGVVAAYNDRGIDVDNENQNTSYTIDNDKLVAAYTQGNIPMTEAEKWEYSRWLNENADFDKLKLWAVYDLATWDKERVDILQNIRQELINKHINNGVFSHTDVGRILLDLKGMDSLTDIEKAFVWSEFANNKTLGAWILGINGEEGDYIINNGGINSEVIDSLWFNEDSTQRHTVVGFDDGYHGKWGGYVGDNGIAERYIKNHEAGNRLGPFTRILPDGWGETPQPDWLNDITPPFFPDFKPNPGDEAASLAMIDAFRGFREGGFDEFADRWINNMLSDSGKRDLVPPTNEYDHIFSSNGSTFTANVGDIGNQSIDFIDVGTGFDDIFFDNNNIGDDINLNIPDYDDWFNIDLPEGSPDTNSPYSWDTDIFDDVDKTEWWKSDLLPDRKPNIFDQNLIINNDSAWWDIEIPDGMKLYSLYSGDLLDEIPSQTGSKHIVFVVNELSENFEDTNPWNDAQVLRYNVGGETERNGLSGFGFGEEHPLKNIGSTAGNPVMFEDMIDVGPEFDKLVESGLSEFTELSKIDNPFNSLADYEGTYLARLLEFRGMVTDRAKWDIKADITDDGTPSYAAKNIGEWVLRDGKLTRYDDFGNISFGVFGKEANIDDGDLTFFSSVNQFWKNITFQTSGIGDEERDTIKIEEGIELYFEEYSDYPLNENDDE